MAAWRRPHEVDIWLTHNTQKHTNTHAGRERGRRGERKRTDIFLLAAQNLSFSPDHMRLHLLPMWRHCGLLWTNSLSFSSLVMGWRRLRMQMAFSDQSWFNWWSNISSITREGTFLVLHWLSVKQLPTHQQTSACQLWSGSCCLDSFHSIAQISRQELLDSLKTVLIFILIFTGSSSQAQKTVDTYNLDSPH